VIGQAFTLWAFVYMAHVLGPEGFGKFSFAQVTSLYFLYLADFGLQTLGTRAIAQTSLDIKRLVAEVSLLRLATAFVAVLLLGIFLVWLPKPPETKFLILIFGAAILPSAILLEWVFQGIERMEIVAVGRILRGAVFAVLVLAFVSSPHDLYLAAAFYVLGIVAAVVVLILSFISFRGKGSFRFVCPDFARLLRSAVPLAVGSFITQVNYNFGTFALGLFLSDNEVGIFSAAHKIILFLWAFVVVAASNAILPLLSRLHSQAGERFAEVAAKLYRLFLFFAVPLGFGGLVLAQDIIGFLYPSTYQPAALVLQIGIWVVVLVIMRVVFENVLVAAAQERDYFRGYVIAGLVTLVGNLVLIPRAGLVAPAIVSLVSEFFLLTYFFSTSRIIMWRAALGLLVRPVGAALMMGVVLVLFPMQLLLSIPLGVVVYIVFLVVFRGLTVEELRGYGGLLSRRQSLEAADR
jgi:O-antigen/teichoic acid export membrane protein